MVNFCEGLILLTKVSRLTSVEDKSGGAEDSKDSDDSGEAFTAEVE